MSFVRENDLLRPELRRGATTTISYWPVVQGLHVTATAASASLYDKSTLLESVIGSVVAVSGVGSRVDFTFSPLDDYYDGLRLDVTFTSVGVSRVDTLLVDCVRTPWADVGACTLQDLMAERPDVAVVLDRLGVLLGYTTGDSAQENTAAIYTTRARASVDGWLRRASSQASMPRPALVLDRRALSRVEVLQALHLVYLANAQRPIQDSTEATDENGALAHYYGREAQNLFSSLDLQYDVDDDGELDAPVGAGVVYTRRVQA